MKSLSDKINWINDAIDWISLVQKTATTSSTMSGAKIVRGTNSNDDIIDDFGNDTIYAGAGNDTLDGGFGRDVLHGEAGNDVFRALEHNDKLYGGLGNDTMESGTGSDIMMFNTALNSRTNVDRINDFSVRYDTIHLENKIFTKLTKTGALSSSAFWTGTKAHDSNDKIIYNKTTGYLYYDQDGTGSKAAALFAKLDKGLALTDKDFYVI